MSTFPLEVEEDLEYVQDSFEQDIAEEIEENLENNSNIFVDYKDRKF